MAESDREVEVAMEMQADGEERRFGSAMEVEAEDCTQGEKALQEDEASGHAPSTPRLLANGGRGNLGGWWMPAD